MLSVAWTEPAHRSSGAAWEVLAWHDVPRPGMRRWRGEELQLGGGFELRHSAAELDHLSEGASVRSPTFEVRAGPRTLVTVYQTLYMGDPEAELEDELLLSVRCDDGAQVVQRLAAPLHLSRLWVPGTGQCRVELEGRPAGRFFQQLQWRVGSVRVEPLQGMPDPVPVPLPVGTAGAELGADEEQILVAGIEASGQPVLVRSWRGLSWTAAALDPLPDEASGLDVKLMWVAGQASLLALDDGARLWQAPPRLEGEAAPWRLLDEEVTGVAVARTGQQSLLLVQRSGAQAELRVVGADEHGVAQVVATWSLPAEVGSAGGARLFAGLDAVLVVATELPRPAAGSSLAWVIPLVPPDGSAPPPAEAAAHPVRGLPDGAVVADVLPAGQSFLLALSGEPAGALGVAALSPAPTWSSPEFASGEAFAAGAGPRLGRAGRTFYMVYVDLAGVLRWASNDLHPVRSAWTDHGPVDADAPAALSSSSLRKGQQALEHLLLAASADGGHIGLRSLSRALSRAILAASNVGVRVDGYAGMGLSPPLPAELRPEDLPNYPIVGPALRIWPHHLAWELYERGGWSTPSLELCLDHSERCEATGLGVTCATEGGASVQIDQGLHVTAHELGHLVYYDLRDNRRPDGGNHLAAEDFATFKHLMGDFWCVVPQPGVLVDPPTYEHGGATHHVGFSPDMAYYDCADWAESPDHHFINAAMAYVADGHRLRALAEADRACPLVEAEPFRELLHDKVEWLREVAYGGERYGYEGLACGLERRCE